METKASNLKKILAGTLLVSVILSVSLLYYGYYTRIHNLNPNQDSNNPEEGKLFVRLIVDFAGILPLINVYIVSNHSLTAYSVLIEAGLDVKVKKYGDMVYVVSINSVIENVNKTHYYWFYYVNGVSGDVASNYYSLSNNSVVRWGYEYWNGFC